VQQRSEPYKTIKEEAEEFKAKMRAMREREAIRKKRHTPQQQQQQQQQKQQKPKHPRESRLHREPSKFAGVLKEDWGHRVELIKFYCNNIKQNFIPYFFCLKAEVEEQE
jgi:DNA-nicking Smr family endonuclease